MGDKLAIRVAWKSLKRAEGDGRPDIKDMVQDINQPKKPQKTKPSLQQGKPVETPRRGAGKLQTSQAGRVAEDYLEQRADPEAMYSDLMGDAMIAIVPAPPNWKGVGGAEFVLLGEMDDANYGEGTEITKEQADRIMAAKTTKELYDAMSEVQDPSFVQEQLGGATSSKLRASQVGPEVRKLMAATISEWEIARVAELVESILPKVEKAIKLRAPHINWNKWAIVEEIIGQVHAAG